MARLLDDDHRHHEDDLCADMSDCSGSFSCSGGGGDCGDMSGDGHGREHHRRHHRHHFHHRLIPVANISVDCRPVTFSTPGQARNVVSCAVSETLMVPVTQTVNVQTPTSFGCFLCTPVTQTVHVPVTATVNLPPVLTPAPHVVCPPSAISPAVCPPVSAPVSACSSCGCRG